MENQTNTQETKEYIKELNKAFSSFTSLVKLVEGITGKELTRAQKQLLSKMPKLSPTSDNTDTDNTDLKWFFSFNFVDELGDVFLVAVDTQSKDWVGIKWTPDGVMVYNKTNGYMAKYTDTYHQYNLKAYPSIKADGVVINFNGNTTPFNAETSLSLVEVGGEYRLLASMKIGGVMAETPLIHTHLGMINQSPVLLKLLTRLEAQKRLSTLTDHPKLELPDKETKTPCLTPTPHNPIQQPIFNQYGAHPSQQFTQQPPFNSFNPQQPYGPQPSFGPTPYPPQQPCGQDITLMRILEQLHSLSEKVDLLLKKQ